MIFEHMFEEIIAFRCRSCKRKEVMHHRVTGVPVTPPDRLCDACRDHGAYSRKLMAETESIGLSCYALECWGCSRVYVLRDWEVEQFCSGGERPRFEAAKQSVATCPLCGWPACFFKLGIQSPKRRC